MAREAVARVLGHAMVDKDFAEALKTDPGKAANSLGLHLGPKEISALKEIHLSQLENVTKTIRDKFGAQMHLDQQQQQARMD